LEGILRKLLPLTFIFILSLFIEDKKARLGRASLGYGVRSKDVTGSKNPAEVGCA